MKKKNLIGLEKILNLGVKINIKLKININISNNLKKNKYNVLNAMKFLKKLK